MFNFIFNSNFFSIYLDLNVITFDSVFISKSESEFDEFLADDNEDNDRVEDADFVLVRLHNILIFFSFKFILNN